MALDATIEFLGLHEPVRGLHIVAWAFLMYLSALVIVRVGKSRFIGRATPFDLIVAFMLGSTLSRAVNGDAPFVPTLAAGFVIVGLHWVVSVLTYKSERISHIVKGDADVLVQDGKVIEENMRRHRLTRGDLESAMRKRSHRVDVDDVHLAVFERNGEITVIGDVRSGDHPAGEDLDRTRRHPRR